MVEEIVGVISCVKTNITSTAVGATLIDFTDMLVDMGDWIGAQVKIVIVWKNSGNNTNNIKLYDEFGATDIADSTLSQLMVAGVYQINESALIPVAAGLKNLMIKIWVSAGTVTIDKVELHIVRDYTVYTIGRGYDAAFQRQAIPKTFGTDAAFRALGITLGRGYDVAFKAEGIELSRGGDAAFQLQGIEEGRGYDAVFQALFTRAADYDAVFRAVGIELARGFDAAFRALGLELSRGFDAAFQSQGIELPRDFDAVFLAEGIEKARGYDVVFEALFEKARGFDAAFQAQGIELARGFDAYFAWFEATTWYAKIQITDLDSVVHDIDPGVLGDGDALSLSLDHLKADDFFFSVEDYAGDKRDWLVRGCIVDIYIDRFKPPTTLRFHGMVEEVKEEWTMPAAVVVKAAGRDLFSIYLDRKVTETYLDTEVSLIVKDLLTIYAPALDQTNIDATTTTLEDARFPYRSLKEILDYLGTVSSFTYRCDPHLNFYWKAIASEDTGIHYASSDVTNPPAKLTSLHPVKNRVFVLGGNYMQVDQEQTTAAATKNTKDFWYAQSFTPTRSSLDQISLYIKRTGDPANLEGEIRTDDPGNGPDEIVATFTIDKDFIGVASSWRPVRVTASLLIGVKYWIVLKKIGDGANNYEWSDDNNNVGENAFDADGVGPWTVQAASYQMAFRTHFSVPVLAVKQDYASRDTYMWREIVHEDKAIVSRLVARETAEALLNELKDLTPNIRFLRTINQTSIPDRGKLVTVTMAPLKISLVQYEVKRVFFQFKGGEDGTGHMDVYLGRSIEELDEWLNRLRLDIDRAKIGSFGIEEGLIPVIINIGPDAVTAGDALNLTVVASGAFEIGTARIGFSDIG